MPGGGGERLHSDDIPDFYHPGPVHGQRRPVVHALRRGAGGGAEAVHLRLLCVIGAVAVLLNVGVLALLEPVMTLAAHPRRGLGRDTGLPAVVLLGVCFTFLYNYFACLLALGWAIRWPRWPFWPCPPPQHRAGSLVCPGAWLGGGRGCLGHPDFPGDLGGAFLWRVPPADPAPGTGPPVFQPEPVPENGLHCPPLHPPAVHRIHRHDAGPERGEQFRGGGWRDSPQPCGSSTAAPCP